MMSQNRISYRGLQPHDFLMQISCDALGRVAATIDALTNETTYAYDAMNRVVAVTSAPGDTTTWFCDKASGVMINKVYSDVKKDHNIYSEEENKARRLTDLVMKGCRK